MPRWPARRMKSGVRLILAAMFPLSQSRTGRWRSAPALNRSSGVLVPRMKGISQILADYLASRGRQQVANDENRWSLHRREKAICEIEQGARLVP